MEKNETYKISSGSKLEIENMKVILSIITGAYGTITKDQAKYLENWERSKLVLIYAVTFLKCLYIVTNFW